MVGLLAVGAAAGGAVATGAVDAPADWQTIANAGQGEAAEDMEQQDAGGAAGESTSTPANTEATATEEPLIATWDNQAAREEAHAAVNEARRENNLGELDWDTRLVKIAQQYAERMAEEDFYSHTSPSGEDFEDRYQQAGYNCEVDVGGDRYLTGAENIAYTYFQTEIRLEDGSTEQYTTPAELGRGVVAQWMGSAGHRENILTEPWRNEGIGVSMADDGKVYVVQNFC